MPGYRFFDQSLDLELPQRLQEDWDRLFGAFRTSNPGPPRWRVRGEETDSGRVGLWTGDTACELAGQEVLMVVQDLVQNHVLPAVKSHLLWHGASWRLPGGATVILGESGAGKSTLSLARHLEKGEVMSDELAALDFSNGRVVSFPRAMAVRPASLQVAGMTSPAPRVRLDEEKVLVPIPSRSDAPLKRLVVLSWPVDPAVVSPEGMVEIRVLAASDAWRSALSAVLDGAAVEPHPDGQAWWRIPDAPGLRIDQMEQALHASGAVLAGFHRGAFRMPDFSGPPRIRRLSTDEAVKHVLPELVNANTLLHTLGAPRLAGRVRSACARAACCVCVPGALPATLDAMRSAGRSG